MRAWTEPSLGQCSYLNMCYGDVSPGRICFPHYPLLSPWKFTFQPLFASNPALSIPPASGSGPSQPPPTAKQCRYQHYRLVPPLISATSSPISDHRTDTRGPDTVRLSKRLKRKLVDTDGYWKQGRPSTQAVDTEFGQAKAATTGHEESSESKTFSQADPGRLGPQWLNMDVRQLNADVLGQ